MNQSLRNLRAAELKSCFDQFFRNHPRARQQSFSREIAKSQLGRKTRDRQNCRTLQHAGESLRELGISHGIGRSHVYRPTDLRVLNDPLDGRHKIVDVNPTPPLMAVADLTSEPQSEREQHLLQFSAS